MSKLLLELTEVKAYTQQLDLGRYLSSDRAPKLVLLPHNSFWHRFFEQIEMKHFTAPVSN